MSQLTLPELARHLRGAADLLRGSIDSADRKHYMFGLLFCNGLCDVWEEGHRFHNKGRFPDHLLDGLFQHFEVMAFGTAVTLRDGRPGTTS